MAYQPIPTKQEDSASASGDSGVPILAVRQSTATDLSTGATNGDYEPLQVDGNGRLHVTPSGGVGGDTASGATDSGNPVKVGGKYNSTLPTFSDGQRGDLQIGTRGSLAVQLVLANSTITPSFIANNADGVAPTSTGSRLEVVNRATIFGGTNFDRQVSVVNATNSAGTGIAAAGVLAQLDDTSPTSITENQFGNLRMSADRSLLVTPRATTPTQTSVAGSASSVSLLAASNARKGATIYNDSTALLYVKLGTTASTTSFTVKLQPDSYYEVPFGYVGAIDGIWASATGNALITELA